MLESYKDSLVEILAFARVKGVATGDAVPSLMIMVVVGEEREVQQFATEDKGRPCITITWSNILPFPRIRGSASMPISKKGDGDNKNMIMRNARMKLSKKSNMNLELKS